MKKKNIIIVILIFIIIGSILFDLIRQNYNIPNNVVIIQYKEGTDKKIKEINVTSKSDIKELSKYVRKVRELKSHEMVNLAIARQIEIKYSESITISLNLEQKIYGYYINKEKDIVTMAKIPKGLYEWVEEQISK